MQEERTNTARDRAIVAALPDLAFLISREGICLDVHAPRSGALRLPAGRLPGRALREVLPESLAVEAMGCVEQALETGDVQVFEYARRLPHGEVRSYEARLAPAAPDEVLVLLRDITARKQTEEALITRTHALGERVKELNGLYAVSKLVSDPDVTLRAIFRQSVRLIPPAWQYPASTCARIVFLGEAFTTDNFRETPWRQAVDIVAAGKTVGVIEVFYLERHGGEDEEPFLQEERHLIEALGRELGNAVERKQAQDVRREAEKQTRYQATLLQSVSEAIIGLDTDFVTIRSWNKAAQKIYGWTADEVVGRSVIDVLRPELLTAAPDAAAAHFLEAGYWTGEVVQQRKDGTRLVVAASASVVKDRAGQVIGEVYVNRDITREKKAEAVLKALEREVLEISHREQRRIGRDLHDGLGAHLTGIAMVCRTLARRAEKGKPVGQDELNHLANLVQEGITEARRLARGLNPVKLEREGLPSALQEMASLMQARSGVSCTFVGDEDWPDLDSEVATQLYRIAQEAAYNALKHARPSAVAIRLEREDGDLVLSVRDDGIGLPRDPSATEGMGLRVMHYRARMIGGRVAVRSTPGGGTLITCTLPHTTTEPDPAT